MHFLIVEKQDLLYINDILSIWRQKLDTDLTPLTKVNSKWIIAINVKYKTTKLLEDNMGENLHDLVQAMTF